MEGEVQFWPGGEEPWKRMSQRKIRALFGVQSRFGGKRVDLQISPIEKLMPENSPPARTSELQLEKRASTLRKKNRKENRCRLREGEGSECWGLLPRGKKMFFLPVAGKTTRDRA